MKNLTRSQRIINHVIANMDLYYSSLIEVMTYEEKGTYWLDVVLGSRRGRRYPLRYTFRADEERQMFIDEFNNLYPDVPILEKEM